MFDGRGLLAVATYRASKLILVIGIDGEGSAGAADRNVELFAVHELSGKLRIDVHDHSVHIRALGGMRC